MDLAKLVSSRFSKRLKKHGGTLIGEDSTSDPHTFVNTLKTHVQTTDKQYSSLKQKVLIRY